MLRIVAPAAPCTLRLRAAPARCGAASRLRVVSKAATGAASAPKSKKIASPPAATAASTVAVQPLLARIASLEQRVEALEQKLNSSLAAKPAAAPAKPAAAEQAVQAAADTNRGNQLNPSCKQFWKARGYASAPWRWAEFVGSDLAKAHHWPDYVKLVSALDDEDVAMRRSIASQYGVVSKAGFSKLESLYRDKRMFTRL